MNIGARQITSLDVLENFLGAKPTKSAISRLSDRQIGDLELLVLKSCEASAWEPSPPGAIYPGGWLANDVANPAGNEYLNLALLYYPKVLIHDPLRDFLLASIDTCRISAPCEPQMAPYLFLLALRCGTRGGLL